MARYIDLDGDDVVYCGSDGEYEKYNIPIDAPTADVRENVYAYWTDVEMSVAGNGSARCSGCGAIVHNNFSTRINYCPNCGSDMTRSSDPMLGM